MDLKVSKHIAGKKCPTSRVCHKLQDGKINSVTELNNVLANIKCMCLNEACATKVTSNEQDIRDALDCLKVCNFEDDNKSALLKFITCQLDLMCLKDKHSRRFDEHLTVLAFLWHCTSPCLYRKIRQVLILPSERRLQQLSSSITVSADCLD